MSDKPMSEAEAEQHMHRRLEGALKKVDELKAVLANILDNLKNYENHDLRQAIFKLRVIKDRLEIVLNPKP